MFPTIINMTSTLLDGKHVDKWSTQKAASEIEFTLMIPDCFMQLNEHRTVLRGLDPIDWSKSPMLSHDSNPVEHGKPRNFTNLQKFISVV